MKSLHEHLLNESDWQTPSREYAWSSKAKYIQINTLYEDEKYYLFLTDGDLEDCFQDEERNSIKALKPGDMYDPEYGDGTIVIRFR